jgi:hypothetical protein
MCRYFKVILCITILLVIGSGCTKKNSNSNGIPLPQSAKYVSANTLEIPFPPYGYDFSGGSERWIIERVGSVDNRVFFVMYNDKSIAKFPLGKVGLGTHKINGSINMGGVIYKGVSITLNKNLDTGYIKFIKAR